jgi:hypothetical protein
MKNFLLIILLFLLLFFAGCKSNNIKINNVEIENNYTSELLNKLDNVPITSDYIISYNSKQGKHTVITKNITYVIENSVIKSMDADFFINAGTTDPQAKNCTHYFDYTKNIPYEQVFNRTESCSEIQKINVSTLKTKEEVVELIKTFIKNNNLSFDFIKEENCYVADYVKGVTVFEKICFTNKNLKSYEYDHTYVGLNSVAKWVFS